MSLKAFRLFGLLSLLILVLPASQTVAQGFSALRQAIAENAVADADLVAFYRDRDFEPVWADPDNTDRIVALIGALETADAHALPTERYQVDVLRAAFAAANSPYRRGEADVLATRMFLRYARDVHSGVLDPNDVVSDIVHTLPRRDPLGLLTEFVESNPRTFLAGLPPQHPEYLRLMRSKLTLEAIAARGGYGPEVTASVLRPGDVGEDVIALRNRLQAMGYLQRSATAEYDATLQSAVFSFQTANGIEPDGVAGERTIDALNRSVHDHLGEIAVAMERQRWLNFDRGERHVFVNITDFHVHVFDNNEITFTTRSVVGARDRDRRTPEFSDMMEHMVINPSWYVPRSIAERSYIQGILDGRSTYLELSANGRVVNPQTVDWSQYTVDTFPFDLRQPPGPRNALGYVKFMFPNRWNIYLHDTPEDHLFARDRRTYSSGCVRLEDPFEFAYHILAHQEGDPEGFFQAILDTRNETYVYLDTHIPVHITYWTAWVDASGRLNFRDDVYGRNALLQDALERAGVVIQEVTG